MIFSLPVSAKIKAVVALLSALVIVATGAVADNVLNADDLLTYGVQVVEAVAVYVAVFAAPRNRVVLTPGERITDDIS